MICSKCGTENEAGRRFCEECGERLAIACPACGAENRPSAKFCGECGQALAGSVAPAAAAVAGEDARQAERRRVSVLFADLVGFTSSAEQADPIDLLQCIFIISQPVF